MSERGVVEQIRRNDYKLLGQIPVSDADYEILLENTKRKIKMASINNAIHADILLSLCLVQIAIRNYKDGKYWKCFQDEMQLQFPASKLNYIGQIFIRTIRIYGLLELNREENSSQMFVENIKAHAFVTDYYMSGFFDFAYAFYENNLFRELTDDITEDIESLSTFMLTTLNSKSDSFSADDSSIRAARSYKLLKSTRAVLAQCQIQTVYALLYPVFEMIDKYYYDNDVIEVPQNRFESNFADWCANQSIRQNTGVNSNVTYRHLFNHKPLIKVDVNREFSYLIIPAQKFRKEDCDGQASVSVTIEGYTETRELELYRSFGMYISEELIIPIPDIFDRIEISITGTNDSKYTIQKSKYRIFNRDWENTAKFSKGHNYILVKPGTAVKWENPDDVIDVTDIFERWQYYSANVSDETICYIDNKPVSIIGEFSAEPIFDRPIHHFSVISIDNKKLFPVREHPGVSFVVPKEKVYGTHLLINNKEKIFLKDIKEKNTFEWKEDSSKLAFNVVLEEILPEQDGQYSVMLDIPGEPNRKLCDYILLRKFNCKLDKPKYIYSETGVISVHKNGHEVYFTNPGWNLDYDTTENAIFSFPIDEDTTSVEFTLKIEDETYLINLPVYTFKWGFSSKNLSNRKSEFIWYSDLGETLYIQLKDATEVEAYWGHDENFTCKGEAIADDLTRIDISPLIDKIKKNYKKHRQYINIKYWDHGKRSIALPIILRNAIVSPYFKLNSENNNVFMDLEVKGKADIYLTVANYGRSDEVIIRDRKILTGKNELPELSPDGFYDLWPFMEEPDEFGFDVERTELRPVQGAGCVDFNNLVYCRLVIKEIIFEEEVLSPTYRYFIHTAEKTDIDEYIGTFYRVELVNGKEKWDTKRTFGRVKILIYQKDEEMKFSLLMFSKEMEEWFAPYYDNERKYMLGCDNKMAIESDDYERFLMLDENNTEYIVDMEKLRRIH